MTENTENLNVQKVVVEQKKSGILASGIRIGCIIVVAIITVIVVFWGGCAGCAAIMTAGTGVGVGTAAAVMGAAIKNAAQKFDTEFADITAEVEISLQNNGFQAGAEKIGGKKMLDVFTMLTEDISIRQPQNKSVYYLGKDLFVNAPCAGDVLFVGSNCNVNQPITGNLLFYAVDPQSGGTLTIAAGVTIGKVIVNDNVKLIGDKSSIKHGVSNDFDEVLKFATLEKNLREKFGDDVVNSVIETIKK